MIDSDLKKIICNIKAIRISKKIINWGLSTDYFIQKYVIFAKGGIEIKNTQDKFFGK